MKKYARYITPLIIIAVVAGLVLYMGNGNIYAGPKINLKPIVSRKVAAKILEEFFGEGIKYSEDVDISSYQMDDGGIALLPYGSSDKDLTVKTLMLDKMLFDTNSIRNSEDSGKVDGNVYNCRRSCDTGYKEQGYNEYF